MTVLAPNNMLSVFFNKYFDLRNIGVTEGDQGTDTGNDLPHMKDKRFEYFLGGLIRSSYNALKGEYGCESWAMQTRENLNKRLARYHDEAGNIDMDVAATDPGVIRLMEMVEAQEEEVSAYTLFLNEVLDAYKQTFRKDYDLTQLTANTSTPVRKVEATEEEKAKMVARLAKLTAKAA